MREDPVRTCANSIALGPSRAVAWAKLPGKDRPIGGERSRGDRLRAQSHFSAFWSLRVASAIIQTSKAVKGTGTLGQRGHQRAGMLGSRGRVRVGDHPGAATPKRASASRRRRELAAVTGQPSNAGNRTLGGLKRSVT